MIVEDKRAVSERAHRLSAIAVLPLSKCEGRKPVARAELGGRQRRHVVFFRLVDEQAERPGLKRVLSDVKVQVNEDTVLYPDVFVTCDVADLATELVFRAAEAHRANHRANEVQLSTLLSIKTGGCPEDCGYCAQSVHADAGVKATKLMDVREVLQSAARARDAGSQRFCMGAAWRNPKERDMPAIVEIVPSDDALLLEARVLPRDIAFLRPGQKALVKFTAYDFATYGGLEATLEHISADTVLDEKGNAFFLVRVRTLSTSLGPNKLPIIPGMVAEVDILTGKKTVLSYLLKPILRAKSSAMTER